MSHPGKRTHLDALRTSESLRRRLVDFALDNHYTRCPKLTQICRALWEGPPREGGLLGELWVEGGFPAESSGQTLTDLVAAGVFDADLAAHLDRVGAMPRDRTLYTHQRDAVVETSRESADGGRPALVVTAGTGAGKTECFLLPLLHDLFRHDEGGDGMRCLILYPMNALINDQVDRLYDWLKGQDRVSLFHFTSETPEDARAADSDGTPSWEACRMRTRQEARGLETHEGEKNEEGTVGPQPDVVITNYSMLEYMLCRPQDAVFFGKSLRAVVLDEAHLYTGTLAAEITLLLRRLYARCGVEPSQVLHIATSATLGSCGDDLRNFASRLFSKDTEKVRVIEGRPTRIDLPVEEPPAAPPTAAAVANVAWLDRPLLVADAAGKLDLANEPELCQRLRVDLRLLTGAAAPAAEDRPSVLLHDVLGRAPLMHRLQQVLWEKRQLTLEGLARDLWGEAVPKSLEATISLLQLAASARRRPVDYPLVPHRLHFLMRPTTGLIVCLNPGCTGPDDRRLSPFGCISAGTADFCPACGKGALSLQRCINCGEWLLAAELTQERSRERYRPAKLGAQKVHFLTHRTEGLPGKPKFVIVGPDGSCGGEGEPGIRVAEVDRCPNCGDPKKQLRPFAANAQLALSIVAEAALAELPEFPAPRHVYLPAQGRRLLTFSDSRSEAARLGPELARQHEQQLIRAAVVSTLAGREAIDEASLGDLVEDVDRLKKKLGSNLTPAQRERVEAELRLKEKELQTARIGGDLPGWAAQLSKEDRLSQILDSDRGETHYARKQTPKGFVDWGERNWVANREAVQGKAMQFLAEEFASLRTRAISAEKLGMAEITYPGLAALGAPPGLIGEMPTTAVVAELKAVWLPLLESLCDTLRMEGVLTLGNRDADREFDADGAPLGQWCAKRDAGPFLTRFTGADADHRRRAFAAAVLRRCGVPMPRDAELSVRLLEEAFDQLYQAAHPSDKDPTGSQLPWLERVEDRQTKDGQPVRALRLTFAHLGLRRPPNLYQCQRTGHVWPRSVLGCAPEGSCDGTLDKVTDDQLDKHPRLGRLRKDYLTSPVFQMGLWAEEHSAQLSSRENRRLQDLFKAGIRNILSATTTLELGIDIGGLTAVLMGNVPPGKANYLQRAGRAGRRSDGSSAVLTFARPRPFDQAVFAEFAAYLSQPLRRPLVFLDRERVARRHWHAYLLGEFFRTLYGSGDRKGAMNAFGRMGSFCGKPKPPYWEDRAVPPVLPLAPPDLSQSFRRDLLRYRDLGNELHQAAAGRLLAGTGLENLAGDFTALLQSVIDQFDQTVKDWNDDYEQLQKAWNEALDAGAKPSANAIRYQLKLLWELTVIEALADRQFLPRYGFPIGVQKLRVIAPDQKDAKKVREEDQFRLERPGLLALGEYVPGSQLLVGGKRIASRGLLKSWLGVNLDSSPGLRGQYCRCEKNHDYYWIGKPLESCPICESPPAGSPEDILLVTHGFTSAAWDPPRRSTGVERVGRAETMTVTFRPKEDPGGIKRRETFGGVPGLTARYREDGELLVFHKGAEGAGFAICLKCGYADSERRIGGKGRGQMGLSPSFLGHAPISAAEPWKVCWNNADLKAPKVLRHRILAAKETTDVMLLDFSNCLGHHAADGSLIATLAYALQRAAARRLELDSREIGVLLTPTGEDAALGAVLYDNVPGGAGHVRELLIEDRALLEEARAVLYLNSDHDKRCESACLDCLLSFDAQSMMAQHPFTRRRALAALDDLLKRRPKS